MYHMLLRLPLFQGMSRGDLFRILEQTTFHFHHIEEGETAFHQGERCDGLAFLMKGTLVAKTQATRANLSLSEMLDTFMPIEPQSLFGRYPNYKYTYIAQSEVSLLSISKQEVYRLVETYEIFRINLLNMLSSKVENLHERIWTIAPHDLEGRMASLIRNLCTTPKGTKMLHCKMEDLAALLDDTRLNVSRILNKWRQEGLIEMRRKEFIIHDLADLSHKMAP